MFLLENINKLEQKNAKSIILYNYHWYIKNVSMIHAFVKIIQNGI